MKSAPLLALTAAFLLGGCGPKASDQLNEAAEQSDPAAAQVLRNEAAALDNQDAGDQSLSAAGSPAQQALENAGAAAAEEGNSQ